MCRTSFDTVLFVLGCKTSGFVPGTIRPDSAGFLPGELDRTEFQIKQSPG